MTSEISFKLDWLTVTFPYDKLPLPTGDGEVERLLKLLAYQVTGSDLTSHEVGRMGYRYVAQATCKVVVMAGDTERQGMCIVLSGQAIQAIGGTDAVCKLFTRLAREYGAKATRYDLAIDMKNDRMLNVLSVSEGYQQLLDARPRSKPKTHKFYGQDNMLETAYFGSRASDRMVRVYDKAREQHLTEGEIWTRFEVEYKGKLSARFDGNFERAVESTLQELRIEDMSGARAWKYVYDRISSARKGKALPYDKPPRKSEDSATLEWWRKSVVGSLIGKMRDDPELGAEMFAMLAKAYREEYELSGKR